MNIGVIDTGVNLLHKDLADKNINCFVLTEGKRVRLKGNSDLIGHGSTKFRYGSNLKRNIHRSNIAIHMMTSAIFQHI